MEVWITSQDYDPVTGKKATPLFHLIEGPKLIRKFHNILPYFYASVPT